MEVDDEDQPHHLPPSQPQMGRQEGPLSKKKTKGKHKATPKDEEGDQEREEEHEHILNALECEGIGHIVAQDAVTNPSAVLLFSQLTTLMEDLRHNLERAHDACRQAENQLVISQKKCLASPRSPQHGETDHKPRKVRGQGDSFQGFSVAQSSDREGLSVGPSSVAYSGPSLAGPSDRDVSSAVPPLMGQSSIQSSRALSEACPISSLPTGSSTAGPSTLRPQGPLPQREQAVPSEDVAM